jgi:hypothetical protein
MGGNSRVEVARVGYTGGIVEQRTVYSSASADGYSPAVTFDDDAAEFQIAFASNENAPRGQPVLAVHLQYYPDAINQTYGTSCWGRIAATRPYAGSEFFRIILSNGKISAPSMLLMGLGPASVALGNRCYFNLDPLLPIFILFQGNSSSTGRAECTVPLPDFPYTFGDVYLQWLQLDPSGGDIVSTLGMHSRIR